MPASVMRLTTRGERTPAGRDVPATIIRRGRQGTLTISLSDQATYFERAATEQLAPAYRNYLTLQVCAERFRQFERVMAAQFQKQESDLERASNEQLGAECERASKQAATLVGPDETSPTPPMRNKDF